MFPICYLHSYVGFEAAFNLVNFVVSYKKHLMQHQKATSLAKGLNLTFKMEVRVEVAYMSK